MHNIKQSCASSFVTDAESVKLYTSSCRLFTKHIDIDRLAVREIYTFMILNGLCLATDATLLIQPSKTG